MLYTFVPNKPFGGLTKISPTNHIFLKTINSEFQHIKVSFTDQNSQPLEREERINLTNDEIYIKGYGFLSFAKSMGKNLSKKYGQKILDSAKKSTTDTIKTALKTAIQKTAEVTGDLIGNKIADKITMFRRKRLQKMMMLIMK